MAKTNAVYIDTTLADAAAKLAGSLRFVSDKERDSVSGETIAEIETDLLRVYRMLAARTETR